jgi:hypothetical protein
MVAGILCICVFGKMKSFAGNYRRWRSTERSTELTLDLMQGALNVAQTPVEFVGPSSSMGYAHDR